MSIRCLIIDDEPLALNVLAGYIQQTPDLQLVDLTTRPRHGLTRVLNGEADLVFLDIEMKELHGMEFLKQASGHAHFILTTAYPDYALQGYEFDVKDYLLKPFSYERFVKAIQKIPPPVVAPASPGYFFVKSEYKLIRVDHADIIYLEALRDYVAIHTIKGQSSQPALPFFVRFMPGGAAPGGVRRRLAIHSPIRCCTKAIFNHLHRKTAFCTVNS